MTPFIFHSTSDVATRDVGRALAKKLKPGDILCLFGELGSGKTTFVKGLAQGLAVNPQAVNSPTFVLLNIYDGKLPLYHFDFYRLEHPDEIATIGYDEFLFGQGVAVVEWAERFGKYLPEEHLEIKFVHAGESNRRIEMRAKGTRAEQIIKSLRK